jgi:transcriptional regulator with XRE-family HTH domain
LRGKAGFSQEALADLAGIDRTYVSALEREKYAATVDMLDRLGKVLGVAAWQLLAAPDTIDTE